MYSYIGWQLSTVLSIPKLQRQCLIYPVEFKLRRKPQSEEFSNMGDNLPSHLYITVWKHKKGHSFIQAILNIDV